MGAKLSTELPLDVEPGEDAPVELIEIGGVIKRIDASKGYGFIVPDNGLADILLHVTCLRHDVMGARRRGLRRRAPITS